MICERWWSHCKGNESTYRGIKKWFPEMLPKALWMLAIARHWPKELLWRKCCTNRFKVTYFCIVKQFWAFLEPSCGSITGVWSAEPPSLQKTVCSSALNLTLFCRKRCLSCCWRITCCWKRLNLMASWFSSSTRSIRQRSWPSRTDLKNKIV